MNNIKVLIYEDIQTYRELLTKAVNNAEYMEVAGVFSTTWNVVDQVKKIQPDVVLMDIEMPSNEKGMDDRAGIKATLAIKDTFGKDTPKIIIISNYEDDERIFEAYSVGSTFYFPKHTTEVPDIQEAIKKAHQGEIFFNAFIASKFQDSLRNPIRKDNRDKLTDLEFRTLELLKQGYTQKEVAQMENINTLNDRMNSIYTKYQIRNEKQVIHKTWFDMLEIRARIRRMINGE